MNGPGQTQPDYGLLACDVFADELVALGGESPPWRALTFLEMGLHDHPDQLRQQVQSSIAELEATPGISRIVLAYGLCGNGLLGVRAGRVPLVIPRAHDCIAMLLGSAARRQALMRDVPGGYFYSPGWIRGGRVPGPERDAYLRDLFQERYPDDPELVEDLLEADRDTFSHYHTALYVDVTQDDGARNKCQQCARSLSWSFRMLEGDPAWLRDLIWGQWDAERFLTVPPGASIALDGEALIAR